MVSNTFWNVILSRENEAHLDLNSNSQGEGLTSGFQVYTDTCSTSLTVPKGHGSWRGGHWRWITSLSHLPLAVGLGGGNGSATVVPSSVQERRLLRATAGTERTTRRKESPICPWWNQAWLFSSQRDTQETANKLVSWEAAQKENSKPHFSSPYWCPDNLSVLPFPLSLLPSVAPPFLAASTSALRSLQSRFSRVGAGHISALITVRLSRLCNENSVLPPIKDLLAFLFWLTSLCMTDSRSVCV